MDPNLIGSLLLSLALADGATPLAALEPFLGLWVDQEGRREQELMPGLDGRVVRFVEREGDTVTAEGAFYWNPLKQQIEGRFVRARDALRFDAAAASESGSGLTIDRVGVNSIGERLVLRETWHIDGGRLVAAARWLNRTNGNPAWTETWFPVAGGDAGEQDD